MTGGAGIETIAQVVQLSVAPVFLLTAIAGLLGVLTNRLARIIDRGRTLEPLRAAAAAEALPRIDEELRHLSRRGRYANRAIALCTASGLLVCAVIAVLFVEAFFRINAPALIAGLFIAAVSFVTAGLIYFLREIYVATESLRIGPP